MEKIRMGVYPIHHNRGVHKNNIRAIPTGEFRCPKAGEWYLSGAIIEAYQAPNDLATEYWIAKRVLVDVFEKVVLIYKS